MVAVAMFSPELELFVVCFDGRHLVFEMPDDYRACGREGDE
jgi:hypothetical protein